jgi:hypothetical protein
MSNEPSWISISMSNRDLRLFGISGNEGYGIQATALQFALYRIVSTTDWIGARYFFTQYPIQYPKMKTILNTTQLFHYHSQLQIHFEQNADICYTNFSSHAQ